LRPLIIERLTDAGFGWLVGLIPTAGFLYVTLFVVLVGLFVKRSVDTLIPSAAALEAVFAGAVGAVVGHRLYFLVISGDIVRAQLSDWPRLALGTASWGAYAGGIAGITIYGLLSARGATLPMLDVSGSCAGLGDVIGRMACLMAGDDFGKVATVPWAIRFPAGSFPHTAHVESDLLDPAASLSLPVHPFQIYMTLNGLLVFLILTMVWRRERARPGRTFAAFLLVYGGTRFWWEFLRHPDAGATGALSDSQWACVVFVVAGALMLLVLRRTVSLSAAKGIGIPIEPSKP